MSNVKTAQTKKGLIEYSFYGQGPVVLIIHGGHGSCRSDYKNNICIYRNFFVAALLKSPVILALGSNFP